MIKIPMTSEFLYFDPECLDEYQQWFELEKVVAVNKASNHPNSTQGNSNKPHSRSPNLALAVRAVRKRLLSRKRHF